MTDTQVKILVNEEVVFLTEAITKAKPIDTTLRSSKGYSIKQKPTQSFDDFNTDIQKQKNNLNKDATIQKAMEIFVPGTEVWWRKKTPKDIKLGNKGRKLYGTVKMIAGSDMPIAKILLKNSTTKYFYPFLKDLHLA